MKFLKTLMMPVDFLKKIKYTSIAKFKSDLTGMKRVKNKSKGKAKKYIIQQNLQISVETMLLNYLIIPQLYIKVNTR